MEKLNFATMKISVMGLEKTENINITSASSNNGKLSSDAFSSALYSDK